MMNAMTDEEVRKFLIKNEGLTGIRVKDRDLYYDDPEANLLYLKFPETPLRATYFARVVSLLGAEDESMFYGAMLWITLWHIGSPQLEKTGWAMIEMMRRGSGRTAQLRPPQGNGFETELTSNLRHLFSYVLYLAGTPTLSQVGETFLCILTMMRGSGLLSHAMTKSIEKSCPI
jgi:hypothetical protein